jgi:hypothetical protein
VEKRCKKSIRYEKCGGVKKAVYPWQHGERLSKDDVLSNNGYLDG